MRITNSMMTNRMLLNMQRNLSTLDKLENQISSTKRISVPSDDPILAARALKFRTNVSETEQYKRNVSQGLSWMTGTDKSFMNVTQIMDNIRTLLVQGANGSNIFDDRGAIATNIAQYMDQLGKEMNSTYAGRYLFSGFRTDQPPVFEADNTFSFNITQQFGGGNVETTKTLAKVGDPLYGNVTKPVMQDSNILKLAYTGTGVPTITGWPAGTTINVVSKNLTDVDGTTGLADAYSPADDEVFFIAETGELVLGKDAYTAIQTVNLTVNYDKTNFSAGDLNPMVYFTCTDLDTGKNYTMAGQQLEYEFGVNTRIAVNTLGKDVYTDKLYADLRNFTNFVKSVQLSDENQLKNKFLALGMTPDEADTAVTEQLTLEKQEIETALYERFNNMLGLVDKHFANISTRETDLGSRMSRLNLIDTRLKGDLTNYKELLSDAQDTDMVEAGIQLSMAKMAYEASLKVGANIMQMTLADYIR